ncbi:uncharacterized protein EKO05_0000837 [Ascochyta rabiei]|uniref:Uncharacterized protein n=1 Tax=Didymella rabiei TaxID=5454 RepID=A0A163CH29_DIDRA|nr:uncharacterized protein EKO05_0000837 [Ascochyta rabiei]KZM22456.1 hypothetical protein ST47_g6362 [Ascochyta rabiei]UPX10166.1 hypothetical protein EKO05_0000837 [Ascochyta rabiei]
MSRLTRKASAMQLLELNAAHVQAEQQALHAEVCNIKDALRRSHTANAMLRGDVERFKNIVRAQDAALRGLHEEVFSVKRELAAFTRLPVVESGTHIVKTNKQHDAKEQMRRR